MRRLLSLPVLLLALCGCGDVQTYCADLEDCTGSDRGQCEDALDAEAENSRAIGCAGEHRAWTRCLARESVCNGALYVPVDDACQSVYFDYQDCIEPIPGS